MRIIRKLIILPFLLLPLLCKSQAHLGSSLSDLKSRYPEQDFKIQYTNEGVKFVSAEQALGVFFYYFDSETDLTYMCFQIPYNLAALNGQVELYNNNYVIISETSWKAYLEGGAIMKIDLVYDEEQETYIFFYKPIS